MHKGEWVYPSSLVAPNVEKCDAVFNMIVSSHHVAIVDSTPLILLGHNYTNGILKDEYLGSDKVTNDMKKLQGWETGFVEMKPGCFGKKAKGQKRH